LGFFIWLEETAISVWIRETPSLLGFPFILYLHTLGLALLAGLSSAVALAILMLGQRSAIRSLLPLFPLMWMGLAINALSGVALLMAYPAKALTNPVFYVKLSAIAGAVGIVQWLNRQFQLETGLAVASVPGTATAAGTVAAAGGAIARVTAAQRRAAWSLLLLWAIATLTGRLLAYTYSVLLASLDVFF
jgi:hypothetical protein